MMISGAPASGKGTQCELIVHKVIYHCSLYVSCFVILCIFAVILNVELNHVTNKHLRMVYNLIEVVIYYFGMLCVVLYILSWISMNETLQDRELLLVHLRADLQILHAMLLSAHLESYFLKNMTVHAELHYLSVLTIE